jgi:hypothetical protein
MLVNGTTRCIASTSIRIVHVGESIEVTSARYVTGKPLIVMSIRPVPIRRP